MGASIVAIIIFFGLDQANLLKFNQKHPNNRHFESLNRCFQEGEKFIEDVIGSDQRGFVGGYPRSHIGVISGSPKSYQVYFVSIVFPREESKKVRCLLFACCCKNSFPDPVIGITSHELGEPSASIHKNTHQLPPP